MADVLDKTMRFNAAGEIVSEAWHAIPAHFPDVRVDAFGAMPNHVHGIIVITEDAGPYGDVCASGARTASASVAAPFPPAPSPPAMSASPPVSTGPASSLVK